MFYPDILGTSNLRANIIAEERQDQNAKRRKIEREAATNGGGPASSLDLSGTPTAPGSSATRISTPGSRPANNNFAARADSIGLGGPKTSETEQFAPQAVQALTGSNHDVVANRRAIRMANMSAAEVLKAELASLVPVKPSASSFTSSVTPAAATPQAPTNGDVPPAVEANMAVEDDDSEVPGLGGAGPNVSENMMILKDTADVEMQSENSSESPRGTKRKHDVEEAQDADIDAEDATPLEEDDDDEADPADATNYALKVNADGTVEQEDTVR